MAQKWSIKITHCSLLEVKKHHPNVTAIVNAANVHMRGGKVDRHATMFDNRFLCGLFHQAVVSMVLFTLLLVHNYWLK